ncbi:MAG TPA: hypothetical protein VKS21_01645 [Spirochaetota bacterium]|nr:hypothetical protein [Spirochaetota bacterium]
MRKTVIYLLIFTLVLKAGERFSPPEDDFFGSKKPRQYFYGLYLGPAFRKSDFTTPGILSGFNLGFSTRKKTLSGRISIMWSWQFDFYYKVGSSLKKEAVGGLPLNYRGEKLKIRFRTIPLPVHTAFYFYYNGGPYLRNTGMFLTIAGLEAAFLGRGAEDKQGNKFIQSYASFMLAVGWEVMLLPPMLSIRFMFKPAFNLPVELGLIENNAAAGSFLFYKKKKWFSGFSFNIILVNYIF